MRNRRGGLRRRRPLHGKGLLRVPNTRYPDPWGIALGRKQAGTWQKALGCGQPEQGCSSGVTSTCLSSWAPTGCCGTFQAGLCRQTGSVGLLYKQPLLADTRGWAWDRVASGAQDGARGPPAGSSVELPPSPRGLSLPSPPPVTGSCPYLKGTRRCCQLTHRHPWVPKGQSTGRPERRPGLGCPAAKACLRTCPSHLGRARPAALGSEC